MKSGPKLNLWGGGGGGGGGGAGGGEDEVNTKNATIYTM